MFPWCQLKVINRLSFWDLSFSSILIHITGYLNWKLRVEKSTFDIQGANVQSLGANIWNIWISCTSICFKVNLHFLAWEIIKTMWGNTFVLLGTGSALIPRGEFALDGVNRWTLGWEAFFWCTDVRTLGLWDEVYMGVSKSRDTPKMDGL